MKKDQFIVLCADTAQAAEGLLSAGRLFADKLRKGLILLTCAADGDQWVGRFDVPHVVLPGGDWKAAIDSLPTAFNAILAITLCDPSAPRRSFTHPKQLLKNFRECKIAYLVVSEQCLVFSDATQSDTNQLTTEHLTLNTVLTIDHQRESKEKLVWASYMARFLGSTVRIMHFDYRDAAFKMRWHNNMRYLEKVFGNLGLEYQTEVLQGSEMGNPDLAAFKQVAGGREQVADSNLPTTGYGLPATIFIMLVPDGRDRDLGDLFSTRPELRAITNPQHIPVLLLNQRDDLYIMCD